VCLMRCVCVGANNWGGVTIPLSIVQLRSWCAAGIRKYYVLLLLLLPAVLQTQHARQLSDDCTLGFVTLYHFL
jgi:hypothetical protein